MRVLVLNQHYWPEIAATAQLLHDLCVDLGAAGHEVKVVCGQPSYRLLEGQEADLPRREVERDVRIVRVPSYRPARRTIPRRVAHYASYFASSFAESLREPVDVALVQSTPPLLLGASGTLLRALRRTPFVYVVQDLYPDVALHLGVLRPGPLARAVELAANTLYRRAAHVIAISDGMADRLVARGVPRGRITVIHNWADTSAIEEAPRDNEFARAHDLVEPLVVQYSGNVGLSQGLEQLPRAAELLRDLPVRFVVVGDGNAREPLEHEVRVRGLRHVRFLPPQPRERLGELLASADVGLVTMRRGIGGDLVPSKLYGIMAAARPVLAAVEGSSEVARVIGAHGCGVCVAPESPEALAEGVRAMLAMSPAERGAMGRAGRIACESVFSRRAATAAYDRVLRSVAR
ncbi:MAG: glycosyltransferase family 4 protein [Sandaracinaceae bacterium]|nr:glycosyltransferase family 4 protein [Sandaracinaceae bacterium]